MKQGIIRTSSEPIRPVIYIVYAIEILAAFMIQSTPGLMPELFGEKGILLLPLAITAAIAEPDVPAVIIGAFCGFLADVSRGGAPGIYSVMLVVICYIVGRLNTHYIKTSLPAAMLIGLASIPLMIFLQFLFYYVFAGYSDAMTFFVRHYAPRILYTLAFMPVFFCFNRMLYKLSGKRRSVRNRGGARHWKPKR